MKLRKDRQIIPDMQLRLFLELKRKIEPVKMKPQIEPLVVLIDLSWFPFCMNLFVSHRSCDVIKKGESLVSKSAYIHLVSGSKYSSLSQQDLIELLNNYQEMTNRTGKQLNWDYQAAAFPYEIIEKEESGSKYLLLKGRDHLYHYLILGIDQSQETPRIQIVLPDQATHGDVAKANELSRFLAKQVQGELHMFNGRVMYFYQRK